MVEIVKNTFDKNLYSQGYKWTIVWDDNSKEYYKSKRDAIKILVINEFEIDYYELSNEEKNYSGYKYQINYANFTKSKGFTNIKDADKFHSEIIRDGAKSLGYKL